MANAIPQSSFEGFWWVLLHCNHFKGSKGQSCVLCGGCNRSWWDVAGADKAARAQGLLITVYCKAHPQTRHCSHFIFCFFSNFICFDINFFHGVQFSKRDPQMFFGRWHFWITIIFVPSTFTFPSYIFVGHIYIIDLMAFNTLASCYWPAVAYIFSKFCWQEFRNILRCKLWKWFTTKHFLWILWSVLHHSRACSSIMSSKFTDTTLFEWRICWRLFESDLPHLVFNESWV